MDWLGRAKISFTHAKSPIQLRTLDGQSTDLLRLCEDSTPPCQLNPLLFNGHMQTFATALKAEGPPVYYKRKIFEQEDKNYAGTFAVDFVVEPNSDHDDTLPPRTTYYDDHAFSGIASTDSKPMLVALHGLSGGSYEIYLRHVLAPLIGDGGWEVCVINSRGCAMSKITTSMLYNARATWDIRMMVKWLRKTFPNRPLFGIGFSLGANMMATYVGEEGSNCQLKAAVVVSNPWNLDAGNLALQRTYLGREVYSKTMGRNLKRLFDLHKDQMSKNKEIDMKAVSQVKYLWEFDREVQCPSWGYPSVHAYYRDASSSDSMLAARIPLFAINATDDPIAVGEALPWEEFKQNPYAVMCTTSLGGHLSWFEWGGGRWHAKPCVNFLNKMAFEVDPASISPQAMPNGTSKPHPTRAVFSPMRRKLHTED